MRYFHTVLILLMSMVFAGSAGAQVQPEQGVLLSTHSATFSVSVKSWKTLRDARVVKQDLDYSCGAASLATLLNEHFGLQVTEEVLLKAMNQDSGRASFEDMQRALPQFGFKAQGFAASWKQLIKLRIPVIVYLKYRKDDHFSVLRGISNDTVWLADPSLGNRTYSREQFLDMWENRIESQSGYGLRGKFLMVLPIHKNHQKSGNFFTKAPRRQSAQAVEQLSIHAF